MSAERQDREREQGSRKQSASKRPGIAPKPRRPKHVSVAEWFDSLSDPVRTALLKAIERHRENKQASAAASNEAASKSDKKLDALKRHIRKREEERKEFSREILEITGGTSISPAIIKALELQIENDIATHDDQLRKKYRKRAELPDPTRSADAEVNRPTQQVKFRVDPRIADAIDQAVAQSGATRSDWLIEAALERIKREHPDLYARLGASTLPEPE